MRDPSWRKLAPGEELGANSPGGPDAQIPEGLRNGSGAAVGDTLAWVFSRGQKEKRARSLLAANVVFSSCHSVFKQFPLSMLAAATLEML